MLMIIFENYFSNNNELNFIQSIKLNTDETFDFDTNEYSKPYKKKRFKTL